MNAKQSDLTAGARREPERPDQLIATLRNSI